MTQDWKRPGSEPPADGNDEAASADADAEPVEAVKPDDTTSSDPPEAAASTSAAEPETSSADVPAAPPVEPEPVTASTEPAAASPGEAAETEAAETAPDATEPAVASADTGSESTPEEAPAETEPEADDEELVSTEPVAAAPAAVATTEAPRRRGAPWLLVIAAAIIPALVVGVAVFFLTSGDDSDTNNAAGIVDGLIRLGPTNQATISSYKDELPPDFARDFPIYEGANIVVSIAIAGQAGTSYFIVLSTPDSPSEVYDYYSRALDTDPWQVEVGRASEQFTGLRFLRPDNINVSGDITLHQSSLDDRTAIYLSFDDMSQAITPGSDSTPFALGVTKPLPPGFPNDVPIYGAEDGSVILDTYFERGQGGQAFVVSFLTRDTQDDVIDFYTAEFRGRGWNVSDPGIMSTNFALSIEFNDADAQSLQGSITANNFDEDPSYTQVDLLVTMSTSRGRGN